MDAPLREPLRLRHGALTVLYDHLPGALTAIAIAVRAGSRFDGAYPGIAHMAEHMLFQGTRRLDQMSLNRRAGELGGEHDADTGYEEMTFHFEVFNEDVGEALALLAEQLFHSTIPAERFAKERRVVVDEIRGRQEDPASAVHEGAWRRFFDPPLGHAICGSIRSLGRITPAAVRRFVGRHFVPANMVLSLAGGISRDGARRAVRRAFPAGGRATAPRPPTARRTGKGLVRLRWRDLAQTYLVRLTAVSPEPRRVLALSLGMQIVGADPDARLFQEIRERLGLGYDVGASIEQGRDWAVAIVSASAGRAQERRLRDTVERTCRAAADGFTDAELMRARKKMHYGFARLADSRLERAMTHAIREASGHPSLARTARILASLERREVEAAWRETLTAPTLTAVLTG